MIARTAISGCVIACIVGAPWPTFMREASAQPAAPAVSLAETLFQEGRKLMGERRFAEACPKLEESERLDPADGTRALLAQCHERQGRTASAWILYAQLAAGAAPDSEVSRFAKERMSRVEANLSRVVLRLSPEAASISDLMVSFDGRAIGRAGFDVPFPVDPGTHRIDASAPGRAPSSVIIDVTRPGVLVIPIPGLEAQAPPAAVSPPPVAPLAPPPPASLPQIPDDRGASIRRTAGFATLGVGLGALTVGVGFGVHAITKKSEADVHCGESKCTTIAAQTANHDSIVAGNYATAFVVGGLVAAATGTILVLTALPARRPKAGGHKVPVSIASMGTLGLSIRGSFD